MEIKQGDISCLKIENVRGEIRATMTPDTAQIIALGLDEGYKIRRERSHSDEPSLTDQAIEQFAIAFRDASSGDEFDRYEPITRSAAQKLGLLGDCVRHIERDGRMWEFHMRTGVRWPEDFEPIDEDS